jgi:ketopantoate hydroxymethyltransferase
LAALRGGYGAAGRTPRELETIVADAVALEAAGAVLLLIEAVPDAVTEAVLAATTVPLIGIGAGPAPHGQVLVIHDLLGLTETPPPFAAPMAQIGATVVSTAREWVRRVGSRTSVAERGPGVPARAMRANSPVPTDVQKASGAHSLANRFTDPPHAPADVRR